MSKIPLLQNKENLAVISVLTVSLVILVYSCVTLVPMILKVYKPSQKPVNKSPIDVETINKAIDFLDNTN